MNLRRMTPLQSYGMKQYQSFGRGWVLLFMRE